MADMTNVTLEEVQHLATLSSLQLSDQEASSLGQDISNILDYINQLDELDTEGVEPTYQVTDLSNVWRDDVATESEVSRQQLLELSTEQRDNQVKVPKVL